MLLPSVTALLTTCVGALLDDSRDRVRLLALQIVRHVASPYIRPDDMSKLIAHLLKECAYTKQASGGADPVQTELEDVIRAVCVLDPATAEATIRKCFEDFTASGEASGSGISKFNPTSSTVSGLLEHCDMLVQFSAKK